MVPGLSMGGKPLVLVLFKRRSLNIKGDGVFRGRESKGY